MQTGICEREFPHRHFAPLSSSERCIQSVDLVSVLLLQKDKVIDFVTTTWIMEFRNRLQAHRMLKAKNAKFRNSGQWSLLAKLY